MGRWPPRSLAAPSRAGSDCRVDTNILSDSSQEFVDDFTVPVCGPPLNQARSHTSLAVSDGGPFGFGRTNGYDTVGDPTSATDRNGHCRCL
jgi:hypothetical protein